MIKLGIAATVVALAVAGCSSSAAKVAKTAPATRASSTIAAFTTGYGQDAALIASHIDGCATPTAAIAGGGDETGMIGKAVCTLLGHQVIIYTWKDSASQASSEQLIAGSLKYFATGRGWDEILGDDAAPDAQQAIAAAVAKSLGGAVQHQ